MSKLLERSAADERGQGGIEEARMQGYPWESCPSLLCGRSAVVSWVSAGNPSLARGARPWRRWRRRQ
eukprot:658712-Pyramimonas_sp.AAC.1